VSVVRLETTVERRRHPMPDHLSYAARLDAVLADGRRVVLLDDRGWSESPAGGPEDPDQIAFTARTVVGPDEDADAAAHWESLAGTLRAHGVAADGRMLAALPHDVVMR
jgi:hypothetical protein